MVNEIKNKVCSAGMAEAAGTGGFRHGGPDEPLFYVSLDASDECDPITDLNTRYVIKEKIAHELADRDFAELYDNPDRKVVLSNLEMLLALYAIQNMYIDEFERYGVTHLRLAKPE